MMKAGIDMMPRKLPSGDTSHTGSWAYIRKNQLKHQGIEVDILNERGINIHTSWQPYDVVYLYHTMDFAPEHPYNLNIFDGPQDHTAKFFERLIWPQYSHVKFISLDYPMPNYGYRCKRKKDRASETTKMSDYWKNVDWDALQAKCDSITEWVLDPGVIVEEPISFLEYQSGKRPSKVKHLVRKLTIGDSHAHSAYSPKSLVLRKDGRTLRGILKKGIKKEINDYGFDYDQVDELTCYWGNIDIRHHLCREADPLQATKDLLARYEAELRVHSDAGKKIELVTPLPIEDESRKLPSTGLYEGTPFYGSRQERQEVVKLFKELQREMVARNGWKLFSWPEHWYSMDGLEFFEYMESPRSVHLARRYYRWDLENDQPNPNLAAPAKVSLLDF
jgi:hypothetical protein